MSLFNTLFNLNGFNDFSDYFNFDDIDFDNIDTSKLTEEDKKKLIDAIEYLKEDELGCKLCKMVLGESSIDKLTKLAESVKTTTTTTVAPRPSEDTPENAKKRLHELTDEYIKDIVSKTIHEDCLLDKINDSLFEYSCWLYNHE